MFLDLLRFLLEAFSLSAARTESEKRIHYPFLSVLPSSRRSSSKYNSALKLRNASSIQMYN